MDTVLIGLNSFNFPLKGSVSIEETIKVQGERERERKRESRNKEDYFFIFYFLRIKDREIVTYL
jgi:hypothetical protein